MLDKYKLTVILLLCNLFSVLNATRCLEGGAGRKRVSVVQDDSGSSVQREKYVQIHNSLNYDVCPGDACQCCSYYYNVTGGTGDHLQEYNTKQTFSIMRACPT